MKFKYVLILCVLVMGLVACGGGGDEVAATAVATDMLEPTVTDTPEPTATDTAVPTETLTPTAVPTDTPVPTATATEMPTVVLPPTRRPTAVPVVNVANFISVNYPERGLAFQIPFDWTSGEQGDFVMAFSLGATGLNDDFTEGAMVLLFSSPDLAITDRDPLEVFSEFVSFSGNIILQHEPVVQDSGTQVTVKAVIEGELNMIEADVYGMFALVQTESQGAIVIGVAPTVYEVDFLPMLEAIISTVKVGEPVFAEEEEVVADPDAPKISTGLAEPIDIGDSVQGSVPIERYQEYVFTGSQGETVIILVEPLNFDLILELYDLSDVSTPLVVADNGGEGVSELINVVLAKDGAYSIRVSGYANAGGEYRLSLDDGGENAVRPLSSGNIASTLNQNQITYQLNGVAGEAFVIWVDPLSDGFDVELVLKENDGTVVQNLDLAGGGERETMIYTPDEDGLYFLEVSGANGVSGGDFELTWVDAETAVIEIDTVLSFGSMNYRVCVPADETVFILVAPGTGFDAIVNLLDSEGGQVAEQVDGGLIGGLEIVYFENPEEANYPLIVNIEGFGGIGGEFTLVAMSLGGTAVMLDGC